MQIPDPAKKTGHDHRLIQSIGADSKTVPKLNSFGTCLYIFNRNDGYAQKKLFVSLTMAFLILLSGGCLKYCAKTLNSLEGTSSETAIEYQKQEAFSKPAKASTPLSNNVLADFPDNVSKHFQYVVLITKSALGAFWNDDPFDISKRKALSSRKTLLPDKRLAISEIKENQIIVTPELLGRIFDNLGKSWYLDWDRLRDTFYPLTIRLNNDLSQNSFQDIVVQALKKSGVQYSKDIQAKFILNHEKLSSGVDEFLASISETEKENIKYPSKGTPQAVDTDSRKASKGWVEKTTSSEGAKEKEGQVSANTDPEQTPDSEKFTTVERTFSDENVVKISPDLKQRIVFISGTSFDGCYIISYLKDNHYGKLLFQKKIAWYADGQVIAVNQHDLIKAFSQLFELDAPTLVLNNKLTKLVGGAMAHRYRKGTGGKLTDKDRQKLEDLFTINLMNNLK